MAQELGNIKKACQIMGYSRDTFYRYQELMAEGGVDNLIDRTRRVPNLKNRVDIKIEIAVKEFAINFPAYGQVRVSNELRKQGIEISGGGVRCIWLRNGLSNFKSRLKALEKKVAEEKIILTEAQIAALERKREDDEYCGNLETHHYELFLGVNDIDHTKTKARHPQTNGICERFHKTILQEFYQITFRKKLYITIDELQTDLDIWINDYNFNRTHQGKMCCGRTPIATWLDGLQIAIEKRIAA